MSENHDYERGVTIRVLGKTKREFEGNFGENKFFKSIIAKMIES